jgi:hypothetical protein
MLLKKPYSQKKFQKKACKGDYRVAAAISHSPHMVHGSRERTEHSRHLMPLHSDVIVSFATDGMMVAAIMTAGVLGRAHYTTPHHIYQL